MTRYDLTAVIEREGERTITQVIFAGVLFLLLLLGVYLCNFIDSPTTRLTFQILLGGAALGAFVWGVMGFLRMQKARSAESITANCPYCDFPMQFLQEPTVDYDCEGCHRREY